MTPEWQAEREHAVAYAKLAVAEDLGYAIGGLVWLLVWAIWHSWWLGVPVGLVVYFVIRRPYVRAEEQLSDHLDWVRKNASR